jgi:outer membrane protein assembly factor BamB
MSLLERVCFRALAVAALCAGCGETPVPPPDTSKGDAGAQDPPPFTRETLGGSVYAPANESVTWARFMPGEMTSPPEVRRAPNGTLVAEVAIERRPPGATRFLSDHYLMRLDEDTGDVRWLQTVEYGHPELDTQGNTLLAWPTLLKKLDPDGDVLWSKPRAPVGAYPRLRSSVDPSDNIVLADSDMDDPTPNSVSDARGFLVLEKLDPEGNTLWTKPFGAGAIVFDGAHVATDREGNVLLLASLVRKEVDFGGGPLAGDAVLAKYDPDGNHLFSKVLALNGPTTGTPVHTDPLGNVFVVNASYGEIDVGLGPLFCPGNYVIKLDPAGTLLWNRCANAGIVTLLEDGGFLVSASLFEAQKLGDRQCEVRDAGTLGKEGALARHDADGNLVASFCTSETGAQYFGNVASDPAGDFFMTAAFTTQLTLLDGSVATPVDENWTAMIAKVRLEP